MNNSYSLNSVTEVLDPSGGNFRCLNRLFMNSYDHKYTTNLDIHEDNLWQGIFSWLLRI